MVWLYILIIGAIAGWLAGLIMKGGGYGLIVNIVLGILGSFVGSWLFKTIGVSIASGTLGDIITSVVGAVIVLAIAGLFKR